MASSGTSMTHHQVRFWTRLPAPFRVAESVYNVPATIDAAGLSSLINQLLGGEVADDGGHDIAFDFVLSDRLIRTDLGTHAATLDTPTERVMAIEYLLMRPRPTAGARRPLSDWISGIDRAAAGLNAGRAAKDPWVIITGTADGYLQVVQVGDADGRHDATKRQPSKDAAPERDRAIWRPHQFKQPVVALSSVLQRRLDPLADEVTVVLGSQDASLSLWSLDLRSRRATMLADATAHEGGIESVDLRPSQDFVATASWDNMVKIWKIAEDGDARSLDLEATLASHNQCVSRVQWQSETSVVSGGWDHAIKIWDVGAQALISTSKCDKVLLDFDAPSHDRADRLTVSGHADRRVRLWDLQAGKSPVARLSGHQGWVSAVRWIPDNPHQFISAGYDGNLAVWDIRAPMALHVVDALDAKKVLEAELLGQGSHCVVGGDDAEVRLFHLG